MWVIDRAGTEKLDNGITLADAAITAGKFDESTAYPLKFATIDGFTLEQIVQIMVAVLAGKVTGGATGTITFKDLADAVNRVVMTVDESGNRSAVTTNFS